MQTGCRMALSRGLRCCQRVFSWVPVVIISSVVLWSYYAYVWELCLVTVQNTLEKAAYLLVFHVVFLLFAWTYSKAIFTLPKQPTKKFLLPYAEKERYDSEERPEVQRQILAEFAKKLPVSTRTGSGAIRFCDRCQVVKPDRCHHCSVCGMCVLKMDHHCPWVNNCIGFSNYKFFLLFLAYSMLYCSYIASTVFKYFLLYWTTELTNNRAKFHVLFLLFVSLMFFISLMFLFGYHCWLVGLNRTTLGLCVGEHSGDPQLGFCRASAASLLASRTPVLRVEEDETAGETERDALPGDLSCSAGSDVERLGGIERHFQPQCSPVVLIRTASTWAYAGIWSKYLGRGKSFG